MFEHLEIGGYEQLRRVANAAGDPETARMVETILGEERNAASSLAGMFDAAAAESLRAVGVPADAFSQPQRSFEIEPAGWNSRR